MAEPAPAEIVPTESALTAATAEELINPSDPKAETTATKPKECDFDKNPTSLYLLIQDKKWDEASKRSTDEPDEACTWVSRRERDGKLRWCLLPLHAAIIFKAPERTIEALLCAYPPGAQCKDDQGMLPIHLAFRNGSSEGVVNLLLVAYPQSINVKDRKGRIPLVLAQASASPNRDAFIRALERGPSYYAVAAAATERAAVTAEQRALFESKMIDLRKAHEKDVADIKAEHEKETADMKEKITSLEEELTKTQETSQVLVDHVNSLEAQLSSRGDTERFLATKIATLDASLKEAESSKEKSMADLVQEKQDLARENMELKEQLERITEDLTSSKATELNATASLGRIRQEVEEENERIRIQLKKAEMERATAKANASVLEAQLKKKIETEQSLASQVSDLAAKLAESAKATSQSTNSYAHRIQIMERERTHLKATVEGLTSKLSSVAGALDAMAAEQERIVAAAARHEETMAAASAAQRRIVDDVARQEESGAEAAREREQIVAILTRQAEDVERGREERDRILDLVGKHEEHMRSATDEKDALVESVARQRERMAELKETTLKETIDAGEECLKMTKSMDESPVMAMPDASASTEEEKKESETEETAPVVSAEIEASA